MDRAKLRLLLQEHHCAAFGWALFCSRGDRDEAEDLLQSVYLSLLEKGARFSGRSSFKTWLFAVIRNRALKRRHRLARQFERMKNLFAIDSAPEHQEREVLRTELRVRVESLLEDLSGRQREVIQLVFYHELTVEEAAGVMGVSIGSARTHYDRGKKRLKDAMQKAGIGNEYEKGRYSDKAAV